MTASPKTTDAMLHPLNAPPDSPIELLLGSKDHATHRPKLLRTNNAANENIQPAAIALPKTADEVARLVRWATASGLRLVVRGAGNDFFLRSIADGALVIDMRHLHSIQVDEGGETVQVGGEDGGAGVWRQVAPGELAQEEVRSGECVLSCDSQDVRVR